MFRCGFYEKEITPPLGTCIPGYFSRREAMDVISKLYAKAVAIESDGKCIIMISADALYLPQSVHDQAVEIIEKYTGVSSQYVMINATHTHTGGPTRPEGAGGYPALNYDPDAEYVKMLGRLIGDCGVLAFQRLEPMTAKFAQTDLYGVAFVRNYIMKDGNVRTNPGWLNPDIDRSVTDIDPELPVFYFYDESGKLRGALMNYALHHCCVQVEDDGMCSVKFCADYSGVISDELKKEYGEDFVSVFINGDCGNVNHHDYSVTQKENLGKAAYIKVGKIMADRVKEMCLDAKPFEIDRVDGVKEELEIQRREIPEEDVAEYKHLIETLSPVGLKFSISAPETREYKRMISEKMLNYAASPVLQKVFVQSLRFGECMLYATPCEMYNNYGKYMKANSPSKINFVAELANGGPGCYIPSPEMFDYNAYESYIASAPFVEETGQRMSEFAVELGKKIY